MLFYISEIISEKALAGDEKVIEKLFDLFYFYKRGKCLIDASRNTFEQLIKVPKLKDFELVYKRVSGYKSIYTNSICFFVVLDYKPKTYKGTLKIGNAEGVIVDITKITDVNYFSVNHLLCENINDCKLYVFLVKYFYKNFERTIHLECENIPGGGSPIKDVAIDSHNNKTNTLVILDSDKNHSHSKLGNTAGQYIKLHDSLNSEYLWYYVLQSREIENLIPIEIISKVKNKQHKKLFEKISELEKDEGCQKFCKFFDFKKGLFPSTIRDIKNNSGYYAQIKSFLLSLGINSKALLKVEQGRWKGHKENAIIGGSGDSLLTNTLNYLYSNEIKNLHLSDYQRKDWDYIAVRVFSLGCAINIITV